MYKLHFLQKLPIDLDTAWDFFSTPTNLKKITPQSLALTMNDSQEDKGIYPGKIISYTVRPLWNIQMEWVTEIIAVEKPHYFIDEQKFGPYVFWHHEHWFSSIPEGVLMEDIVYYKLPFGLLGKALHHLKIKKDLENIFFLSSTSARKAFW